MGAGEPPPGGGAGDKAGADRKAVIREARRYSFSNTAQVIRYSAASQYSRAIERFHLSKDRNGTGKRQKCRSRIHGRARTASRYDTPAPRIMASSWRASTKSSPSSAGLGRYIVPIGSR